MSGALLSSNHNEAVEAARRRLAEQEELEDAEFNYDVFKNHPLNAVDWRSIPLFDTTLNADTLNEETEAVSVDIQALQNIGQDLDPETEAEDFKRQGNEALKKGKEFRVAALKMYTKAIRCNVTDPKKRAVYFSNRAHANLVGGKFRCGVKFCFLSLASLLSLRFANKYSATPNTRTTVLDDDDGVSKHRAENYGNCISDCKWAIKLDETAIKPYYRAAKASLCLKKLDDCAQFCLLGLKVRVGRL